MLASHQEAGCPGGGGGENLREPRNQLRLISRGKQHASHLLLFQETNGKRDRAAYGRVSLLDGGGLDGPPVKTYATVRHSRGCTGVANRKEELTAG